MQGPNLHTLWGYSVPLYVERRGCRHRAALSEQQLGGGQGSMTEISALKLRCRSCGGRDIKRSIPYSDERRADWLAGGTILMRQEA